MRSTVPIIRSYIRREFLLDKQHLMLDNDADLIQAGIVDSLAILMLIDFLQDEFGIELQPEDVVLQNFGTINAINNFIMAKRANSSVAALGGQ